jgi:hypothetical protein
MPILSPLRRSGDPLAGFFQEAGRAGNAVRFRLRQYFFRRSFEPFQL